MTKISLIIPTLNAEKEIGALLDSILSQTVVPEEVLVVDSSSDDDTQAIVRGFSDCGVRLHVINRADFNHGGTRHDAFMATTGEFTLFMTQDALPADPAYIENLLKSFSDEGVALVYGRQLPKPEARRFVRLVQAFNYPERSEVRNVADIDRLGIKAFFCSDVCSAYRRSAYMAVGGFERPVNTNEDMLMAARLLRAGHKVAYQPAARVYHSHNLTPGQQFTRNREVGQFLRLYSEELSFRSEMGEGAKLVRSVSSELIKAGRFVEFGMFGVDCAARLLGNRSGRAEARKSEREGGAR